MEFEEKVAIVTGAARGMGYSHCLAFAKEGAHIAAVSRCKGTEGDELSANLKRLVSEVQALGKRAIGVKCDVSRSDQVKAMVDRVLAEFRTIDILVNNAGIEEFHSVVDTPEEEWDQVIDVNLKGVFLCCKYVVPHMIEKRNGKVINISSIFGYQASPYVAHYCASKFGVVGFTQSLAQEVAKYNINVNAVGPGPVDTDMAAQEAPVFGPLLGIPTENYFEEACKRFTLFGREVTPEDVSNAVLWLASEKSRNLTGQLILVDAGHV